MRSSIYINPQTRGAAHDRRLIKEVLGQIDLAERLGFEDVWLTEHHFSNYNAYSDPMMLAAAITQRNPRLRIGFSLAVVPLHHPVRFAVQANLLDQLTDGRVVIGIGPGNSEDEFRGYGLDAADRHAMIAEFVEVLEQAWAQDPEGFAYDGRFWRGVVKGRVIPAPVQQPHPHVAWGTETSATVELIGRKGWSWLIGPYHTLDTLKPLIYRLDKGQREAGLSDEARARAWAHTGYMRQICVLDPGEDVEETIGEYITNYVRESLKANFGIDNMPKDKFEERRAFFKEKWLAYGTAEELIERFTPYAKLGIGHLMCWFNFGYLPDDLVRRSIIRYAADVLPALAAIEPDPELQRQIAAEGEHIAPRR
jgi:alkanesulfonate monooxygenase SsuD/methylene tetrahydromethanopterin reductase-like flavin-dependent oxidoreductase (luciferase family)